MAHIQNKTHGYEDQKMQVAMDTETNGTDFFHGCKPFMVTATDGKEGFGWDCPVDPLTREPQWNENTLKNLQDFINRCTEIIFHNTNFDRRALETIGITIPKHVKIHDTLIAYHCLSSSDVHGLKPVCYKLFNYPMNDEQELIDEVIRIRETCPKNWRIAREGDPHFPALKNQKWSHMDYWLAPEKCREYAGHDVMRTFLLHHACQSALLKQGLSHHYEFRLQLLDVFYDLETRGINTYKDRLEDLIIHNKYQIELIRQKLQDMSGDSMYIDPAKENTLEHLIVNVFGIDPIMTDSGKVSTSAESLKKYQEEHTDHQGLLTLTHWRKCNKQITDTESKLKWLVEHPDGTTRLHSKVNITGTNWTRQSTSGPNQQNFDKTLKWFYGPPKGFYWLYADVKNIELRIWAYEVGSEKLINLFEENKSVHELISRILYRDIIKRVGYEAFKETKTYTDCKSGTFARIYGGSERKADLTYGVPNASKIIASYIPEIGEFFNRVDKELKWGEEKYGYPSVLTRQGFKLEVPRTSPHKACNAKIQGTAGLIMQAIMIAIHNDQYCRSLGVQQTQQIHDSNNSEIVNHAGSEYTNQHIVNLMEKTGELYIPTCPMDSEVIEYEPNYVPRFKDWSTTTWYETDGIDKYEFTMDIVNDVCIAHTTIDEQVVEFEGRSREEVKRKVSAFFQVAS